MVSALFYEQRRKTVGHGRDLKQSAQAAPEHLPRGPRARSEARPLGDERASLARAAGPGPRRPGAGPRTPLSFAGDADVGRPDRAGRVARRGLCFPCRRLRVDRGRSMPSSRGRPARRPRVEPPDTLMPYAPLDLDRPDRRRHWRHVRHRSRDDARASPRRAPTSSRTSRRMDVVEDTATEIESHWPRDAARAVGRDRSRLARDAAREVARAASARSTS